MLTLLRCIRLGVCTWSCSTCQPTSRCRLRMGKNKAPSWPCRCLVLLLWECLCSPAASRQSLWTTCDSSTWKWSGLATLLPCWVVATIALPALLAGAAMAYCPVSGGSSMSSDCQLLHAYDFANYCCACMHHREQVQEATKVKDSPIQPHPAWQEQLRAN